MSAPLPPLASSFLLTESPHATHYPRRTGPLVVAAACLCSCLYFAWVIAPAGLGVAAPTVAKGLLPEWVGCREILQLRDPYRPEVRLLVARLESGNAQALVTDNHRFAYPFFFVLLFWPMAVLPFAVAQVLALVSGAVLFALSVRWWMCGMPSHLPASVVTMFAFAAYPTLLALQLRQPTLLITALLAATFYCVRSERLILAGVLAGLGAAKPHLAIAVVLPLAVWSLARWRTRKRFPLALCTTGAVMLITSELLLPGWFWHWLGTVRAYSNYAGATPLLLEMLPRRLYLGAAALLVGAIVAVSWRVHDSDLLFALSFSIAAFHLVFPFQIYNQLLLLAPTIWVASQAAALAAAGQLHCLLRDLVWVLLGAAWTFEAGLSIVDLVSPGSAQVLWQVPLVALWLYPWPLFLTLSVAVFGRSLGAPGLAIFQTWVPERWLRT